MEAPRGEARYRVGLLTGCVQDLAFSDVNRDTADVLLANGCEVITPRAQPCCGSLHAHNGELRPGAELARQQLDMFDRWNRSTPSSPTPAAAARTSSTTDTCCTTIPRYAAARAHVGYAK